MTVGLDDKAIARRSLAKIVNAIRQTMSGQQRFHRLAVGGTHLNHAAKLFVKQRGQTILAERGDINLDAAVAGKGHLGQRDQQAAVRPVVPRQQLTFSHQRLHRIPEAFQLRDIANVGSHIAKLTVNLRQRGRAQGIVPLA